MYYILDKQHDIKNYNQSHKNDTSYRMIQPQAEIVTKDITNSIIKITTNQQTSNNSLHLPQYPSSKNAMQNKKIPLSINQNTTITTQLTIQENIKNQNLKLHKTFNKLVPN